MSYLYSHNDQLTSISGVDSTSTRFATTSIDGLVKLYDLQSRQLLQEVSNTTPILGSCFVGGALYISCVDGSVRMVDLETSKLGEPLVECHSKGASCVTSNGADLLISGSWDKTVQVIDLGDRLNVKVAHKWELPGKVVAMDVYAATNTLVVAMTDRLVHVYDLGDFSLVQKRESGLKYQIRSVSCFEDGFCVSSIEGKVALEYYSNEGNYAFRCHRGVDHVVNSVNCCCVVKGSGKLLYTGGDDGNVIEWDYVQRKKLKTVRVGEGEKVVGMGLMGGDRVVVITERGVYVIRR